MALTRGERKSLGQYDLICEIASGWLGPWWAVQLSTGGGGAVARRIRLDSAPQTAVDSLSEAAWSAMEIHHEAVPGVIEVAVQRNELAVIFDFVDGISLGVLTRAAQQRKKPLGRRLALRIMVDFLEGLDAAHSRAEGLVELTARLHGGVTPESVWIGADGRTRLGDVLVAGAAARIPTLGGSLERISYSAPESTAHPSSDPRTDVFSAGVMLWELLAERRLFIGSSKGAVEQRVLALHVPRLDQLETSSGKVPSSLAAIVARALAREPKARFGAVAELRDALRSSGEPCAGRPELAELLSQWALPELVRQRQSGVGAAGRVAHPASSPAPGPPALPPSALAPLPPSPQPSEPDVSSVPARPTIAWSEDGRPNALPREARAAPVRPSPGRSSQARVPAVRGSQSRLPQVRPSQARMGAVRGSTVSRSGAGRRESSPEGAESRQKIESAPQLNSEEPSPGRRSHYPTLLGLAPAKPLHRSKGARPSTRTPGSGRPDVAELVPSEPGQGSFRTVPFGSSGKKVDGSQEIPTVPAPPSAAALAVAILDLPRGAAVFEAPLAAPPSDRPPSASTLSTETPAGTVVSRPNPPRAGTPAPPSMPGRSSYPSLTQLPYPASPGTLPLIHDPRLARPLDRGASPWPSLLWGIAVGMLSTVGLVVFGALMFWGLSGLLRR